MATRFVTVRAAGTQDAALLARLGHRAFCEAFEALNEPENFHAYASRAFAVDTLAAELQDDRGAFFLALDGDDPAGYFKLFSGPVPACVPASPATEIARFYALKKFWGRGVGDGMMQCCLDLARQRGAAGLWLSSWQKNARGNAFYRKWGFRIVGEQPFHLGGDVQADFLLARGLSPAGERRNPPAIERQDRRHVERR